MKTPKTILITGGTGFVGKRLSAKLLEKGYKVRVLTRDPKTAQLNSYLPIEFVKWDPLAESAPQSAFNEVSSVVHLLGESVAGKRWNNRRKKSILESRVTGTRNLLHSLQKTKVESFISASAIGIYGDREDENLSETSRQAKTFLADVCSQWELEAQKISTQIRTTILRIGIVLGHESGALKEMLPIFRLGFGGPLGSGKQWMSWIHVDDLVSMIIYTIEHPEVSGTLNAVSPSPVTNKEFTQSLSHALGVPAILPAPKLAIKLAFGEMSTIVLASQKIVHPAIQKFGFRFQFESLPDALSDLVSPHGLKGSHVLETHQFLALPQEKVFQFFSDAKNLEHITPPWLNFRITGMSTHAIQQGTLFDYKLKIHGIPIRWRTLISLWEPQKVFRDEMLKGPYKYWHHTHTFKPMNGGILMTDRVCYKVPFGILGEILAMSWVRKDVDSIFKYRAQKILEWSKT